MLNNKKQQRHMLLHFFRITMIAMIIVVITDHENSIAIITFHYGVLSVLSHISIGEK